MASTITNLINTIDTGFPVAGQNNDSQGFRTNFNIIQSALLSTESEIETLQTDVAVLQANALNGPLFVTTSNHINATIDLTVGSNIISTGSSFSTVISAGGGSGNVVMTENLISTTVLDYLATNATTATAVYLLSANNISPGATFSVGGNPYTVTSVGTDNSILMTPYMVISDVSTIISAQTPVIFTNPFIPGQTSVTGLISDAVNTINSEFVNTLGVTGYQKLPGGMIMQWGTTGALTGDSTPATITFSPAFPTACLNMQATVINANNLVDIFANVSGVSASGATILANTVYGGADPSSHPVTIYWFAIGH